MSLTIDRATSTSTFGHKMCEFQWRSVELNSTKFPLLCWYRSTRIHGINMYEHFFQTCTFRKLRLVRLVRPCTCQKVPVGRIGKCCWVTVITSAILLQFEEAISSTRPALFLQDVVVWRGRNRPTKTSAPSSSHSNLATEKYPLIDHFPMKIAFMVQ